MASEMALHENLINKCSSCASWKVAQWQSESRIRNHSSFTKKIGLCIGGGFDGLRTQEDETCSMWKPLIDKHRVMPIFHPKTSGEN